LNPDTETAIAKDFSQLVTQIPKGGIRASGNYKYDNFWEQAPPDHRIIAQLRVEGVTVDDICDLTKIGKPAVMKVLAFEPVRQYIAYIKFQVQQEMKALNARREKMAVQGFEYQEGVVKGSRRASRVRLDASMDAQDRDPKRRFAKPTGNEGTSTPQTTDSLTDFVEKSRRMLTSNEVIIEDSDHDTSIPASDPSPPDP